ncbi:MAG: DNA methyltransferase [Candidatus Vecturithrix sp.]|jgi:SAM-dependent methyltransferase|nr:DNA methyltransferase [Candidatus Vecturithrix sp.]
MVDYPNQLSLFQQDSAQNTLDSQLWRGSFNGRESTFQQLSPYVGKMKSGMAKALIELYTKPNDIVLDPFSGSGVVPFEAALHERQAWANDLSFYAYVLTRGKLEAPRTLQSALEEGHEILKIVERESPYTDVTDVPEWVREFFHPDTLKEVVVTFRLLRERENYFLLACLLGILHHVRPGFLSYPASHLVPYLRKSKYPPEEFPDMYQYRDVRSRLMAKIQRAYRRQLLPQNWGDVPHKVVMANAMSLPLEGKSVDAIISSPPYFGALDYARDNRLRLWFLGVQDWKELDASLTASSKVYLPQMKECLQEMYRVLKPGSPCILVLGDVERNGNTRNTAQMLSEVALEMSEHKFAIDSIYTDHIPDDRRSRRKTKTTKFERILVMYKK